MEIPNTFNYKASVPDISNVIQFNSLKTASDLNCMKIATVEEVHYDDLTVTVRLLNKRTLGNNPDGTPNVRDYALIRAKICYCCPFLTFPINKGDDCVLLFSDREIESWFINGDTQPVNYQRMHDLTDAFAIFGIRSLPKIISVSKDCLNLFYGNNGVKIKSDSISLTKNGTDTTCIADGQHTIHDGSIITTVNGIITDIT